MERILIVPSILDSDFGSLREVVRELERCKADGVHIDVMDGRFVPNITMGPAAVSAMREGTHIPFETHLMIENPERYIKQFSEAGSDRIIVHYEAAADIKKAIKAIRMCGAEPGIAINPETSFKSVSRYVDSIHTLLVMSVHPGFGGQKFIDRSLRKIAEARDFKSTNGCDFAIAVDGGIDLKTGKDAVSAGAEELCPGSAIFKSGNIPNAIKKFRTLGN